ncbi:MAG: flagellar FliL protein [Paraglaciecola sp.]|jgi:flagellar FliL protein
MAEEELKMEEGSKKGKMMIIIIVVVVLLAAAGGAFFFMGGADEAMPKEGADQMKDNAEAVGFGGAKSGTALYVAMPRPFVFNVPGASRDRLVEIKVQLMVRGTDSEEKVKMHIPLVEGTLLSVFSTANAEDLVTEAGKTAIRDNALKEVQKKMQEIVGNQLVEQVLFTGFVMQ